MPLYRFLSEGSSRGLNVDAVAFQTEFDVTPHKLQDIATRVREACPGARLAYLDWFAPTDLRFAEALDGNVDAYVKKAVLLDRAQYGQETIGDTNLSDYFMRRFSISGPTRRFKVPQGFWSKVWLAPHFGFTPDVVDRLSRPFPENQRDVDLNSRITVSGTPWYSAMRNEALGQALALEGRFRVACRGRVSRLEYFREMERSKLCFSPFGYGEVCWRDFEAMCTGALLLKPDMSHLDCRPASFEPYRTYVPLRWDLSDFSEKVSYYLTHESEREAIVRRAFETLRLYFREERFLKDVRSLLKKLSLSA